MKKYAFILVLLLIGQAAFATTAPQDSTHVRPQDIARQTMEIYFGEKKIAQPFSAFAEDLPVQSAFKKPAGVFVTLSRKGKTRACWGSVNPQYDSVSKAVVFATLGALTKEYRFPPIKKYEWKKLHVQVTVVKEVEPVSDFRAVNPLRDGLMVRSGGKAGVILPGEASDSYYQLVLCKLKAGIKPKETCQLYRIRTDIYE